MEAEHWKKNLDKSSKLYKELIKLNSKEKEEAFSGSLEFGTGGIRSIMGVGSNRLNIYTIRKITYGFAKYLVNKYKEQIYRGVCISHDNRYNSREFSIEASRVLGSLGIRVFMFDSLRPTPLLSYSVRYTNAISGIMITASHNTKEYNGYKIYDSDGCQLLDEECLKIKECINDVVDPFKVNTLAIDTLKLLGLYKILDDEVTESFIKEDSKVILNGDLPKNISVVYTPLHGTGSTVMPKALEYNGFTNVKFVKEQMINDPSFRTVQSPNPENSSAFNKAIELAKKNNSDMVLATDPDADRLGVSVLDNKKYHFLSGNDTGALLLNYILSTMKERGELGNSYVMFDTIVTGPLGRKICKEYNVKTISSLTGFKYIGSGIKSLENTKNKFLFGYEESYGCLIKDNVRDKDSIQASLLILDMANYYLSKGLTLVNVLDEIHKKYGYYYEETLNVVYDSIDGKETMSSIINGLREKIIYNIGNFNVSRIEDYLISEATNIKTNEKETLDLPKSNVIKYVLDNDMFVVVRPSGTEPKLKIYFSVNSSSSKESIELLKDLEQAFKKFLKGE